MHLLQKAINVTQNLQPENESHDEGQEGVTNMICKLFQQQGAPEVEVDKFSGNPLKYQYFSAMFKVVVERKIKDPAGRLTHLINFTDGEAKDLIKNCIHLAPDIGFNTAIMLPNKSCNGNPHSLLASNRKEIKLLALFKPGDAMVSERFIILLIVRSSPQVQTATHRKHQKSYVLLWQNYQVV